MSRAASRQSVINDRTGWAVVLLVGLLPIGLGASRPILWLVAALLISIGTFVYCVALWRGGHTFRLPMVNMQGPAMLYLALIAFMIVQLLPIGQLVTPAFRDAPGSLPLIRTLSLAPGATYLALLQFITYGLLFFVTSQICTNQQRALAIFRGLFVITAAHGLYGIIALTQFNDTLLFMQKWAYEGAVTGTFVNRNAFATFLGFGATIGSALTLRGFLQKPMVRSPTLNIPGGLLYGIGSIIVFCALIATQSRMGAFAGILGAMLTVSLILVKHRVVARTAGVVISIGAITLCAPLILYGGQLWVRGETLDHAFDIRRALYEQVWSMIVSRPMLGHGAGSFEVAFLFYQKPIINTELVWDKAHSTYLSLWAEFGFLAGSIPIILMIVFARRLWIQYARSETRWFPAAMALGVLLTAAIHSLVDFSLEIQGVALLFTTILAAGGGGSLTPKQA